MQHVIRAHKESLRAQPNPLHAQNVVRGHFQLQSARAQIQRVSHVRPGAIPKEQVQQFAQFVKPERIKLTKVQIPYLTA